MGNRLSFKGRLLLLVALAVSLPAVVTCIVLGTQLNSQARALFATRLQANLDTFLLLLRDIEGSLAEGVRRTAADNTVQVTLELQINAQLTEYLEAQREVMGIAFLAAFDRDGDLSTIAASERARGTEWHLAPLGIAATPCTASEAAERQIVSCGGTVYLVSVAPIIRDRDGIGDAATLGASRLGTLAGGTEVGAPALLASLGERQLGEGLIWVNDELVHSSLATGEVPLLPADRTVGEYEIDDTAYLGAATSADVGANMLRLGLLSPLDPLKAALFASVTTVAGIGVLVVAATLIILSFLANRMLRPIAQLREGAARIGAGDLGHRISVRTGDEIETLADQFNDMSGKLQESHASLERKVEERTRENVQLFGEVQARTRELEQARLRRFLAPQVAELLLASGERDVQLESRRCEVTVVFCDLRGFTAFAESSEPEEVMTVLREYHAALGELIFRFEGTLERFVGDGLLVVFNDPVPAPDHPIRAVKMAIAMRECMRDLTAGWRRYGHELGFGIGIAQGYATVGLIGFDRRLDYAVIGSIPNLASRLCDAAKPEQILVSQRVFVSVEHNVDASHSGDLVLKGFQKPVPSYEIAGWRLAAEASAATSNEHTIDGTG